MTSDGDQAARVRVAWPDCPVCGAAAALVRRDEDPLEVAVFRVHASAAPPRRVPFGRPLVVDPCGHEVYGRTLVCVTAGDRAVCRWQDD